MVQLNEVRVEVYNAKEDELNEIGAGKTESRHRCESFPKVKIFCSTSIKLSSSSNMCEPEINAATSVSGNSIEREILPEQSSRDLRKQHCETIDNEDLQIFDENSSFHDDSSQCDSAIDLPNLGFEKTSIASSMDSRVQPHCCCCHCDHNKQIHKFQLANSSYFTSRKLHTTVSLPVFTRSQCIAFTDPSRKESWMEPQKVLTLNPDFSYIENKNSNNNNTNSAPSRSNGSNGSMDPNRNTHVRTDRNFSAGTSRSSDSTSDSELSRSKFPRRCPLQNKGLIALLILLVIITISTLGALIYFAGFGRAADSGLDTTSEPIIPEVEIALNQTLFCGKFPSKYIPIGASIEFRSQFSLPPFNPILPNDSRIEGRVVGGIKANILQYPWQNNSSMVVNDRSINENEGNRKVPNNYTIMIGRGRVFGGSNISIKDKPWQVSLWIKEEGMSCGGTIIMKDWIITAAHCFTYETNHDSWEAYMGMSALSERYKFPAQRRDIESISVHALYQKPTEQLPTFDYDVALLKLDKSVEFSEYIQPICLPSSDFVFPAYKECYVSGWGATTVPVNTLPDVLQQAQVDIIPEDVCSRPDWLGPQSLSDRMICAGKAEGVRDACQGDSGGPLSCYDEEKGVWTLAGSVSWGHNCGLPKFPGVYANMTYFADWIWNIIGSSKD